MREKIREIIDQHDCDATGCTCADAVDKIAKLVIDDLLALIAEFSRRPFTAESLSEFFRGQEQGHRDVETALQRHAAAWEQS